MAKDDALIQHERAVNYDFHTATYRTSRSAASRRGSGPATTGIDKSYKLQMNI